jgi:hypothetical protein
MVSREETQLWWALVENGEVIEVIDGLLSRWRNIAEMHRLGARELRDLSWAGFPNTAWLPVRFSRPEIDPAQDFLEGPCFQVVGHEVVGQFTVRPLPPPPEAVLRGIPVTWLQQAPAETETRDA